MNEAVMATPAISDGVIVIRTLKHVYGIGEPGARPASPGSLTQKKK
ncbi:MAG TPA: hypothetical protein VGQ10_07385 [Vicinamibacterales bacterium]|jgi:hypothetical protein|nr:hypothetical protein [Vicinamibacterales bacterium]